MGIICIALLLLLFFSSRQEAKSREQDLYEEDLRLRRLHYEAEKIRLGFESSVKQTIKITEELSEKWDK